MDFVSRTTKYFEILLCCCFLRSRSDLTKTQDILYNATCHPKGIMLPLYWRIEGIHKTIFAVKLEFDLFKPDWTLFVLCWDEEERDEGVQHLCRDYLCSKSWKGLLPTLA